MFAAVVVSCLISSASAVEEDNDLIFGFTTCSVTMSSYFTFRTIDECQATIEDPIFAIGTDPEIQEFYFCIPELGRR